MVVCGIVAVGAHLDRALPLVVVASPPNSGNSTAPLTGSFNEPVLVATVLVSICLGVVLIFDYVAIRTLLQNRAKRRR